ncbi:hypothetical protein LUZ61_001046 [Rhynchospora tenuis]|uniref:Uncharacterized protein n=1 Tax=Rhynchospora tenuis TaxID=198213 RepID=A0AAD5ZGH4_9POAL|nr:hypothetical protein LUZ61_001046 [Rhynchospora tenuis]
MNPKLSYLNFCSLSNRISPLIGLNQGFFNQTQGLSIAELATMPATATAIGMLLGLGTQMYSNALRKLPYMRHPWEHVIGMGLGAVFVNSLVKWDEQLKVDLDKMLDKAKAANERRYFDDDDD